MGERPTLMRLPMALRPLTWLAARVYGVAVGWRNARLSKGIGVGEIRVRGVGIGVISVGNITVGGTGKSPFVAWICGEIARLGRRPVIGMRGYTPGLVRRNAGGSSMALLCDEAQEYALTAPMASPFGALKASSESQFAISCRTSSIVGHRSAKSRRRFRNRSGHMSSRFIR